MVQQKIVVPPLGTFAHNYAGAPDNRPNALAVEKSRQQYGPKSLTKIGVKHQIEMIFAGNDLKTPHSSVRPRKIFRPILHTIDL